MRGLQNCRGNVYKANAVFNFLRRRSSGKFEDQWNVNRFIIKKNAVVHFAVFAEGFAVIRHNSDQRGIEHATRLHAGNEFANRPVGVGNFSVVRLCGIPCLERFRRGVRIVRII